VYVEEVLTDEFVEDRSRRNMKAPFQLEELDVFRRQAWQVAQLQEPVERKYDV